MSLAVFNRTQPRKKIVLKSTPGCIVVLFHRLISNNEVAIFKVSNRGCIALSLRQVGQNTFTSLSPFYLEFCTVSAIRKPAVVTCRSTE
jgi:hypothetical protein